MAKFSSLPVIPLTAGTSFSHPPELPEITHMDDPAIEVMLDFKLSNAITIGPEDTISDAAMEMRVCHTHLLLVIDKEKKIIGMITTEDLMGEKPLKVTQERQIRRAEILVRMVMIKQKDIAAIDINDLKLAKVGNIIETLHELKQHYALVVETDGATGEQIVRGLFSLWDISKRIGTDVTYDVSKAKSIAELQQHLKKG